MDAVSFEESMLKWINEIFEEEPLPFEINNLYFVVVEDKNTYHLEFAGSENFTMYNFEYQPPCAEHFICSYDDKKEDFILKIKYLINKINKENIFYNKKIYLINYSKETAKLIK